MLKNETYIIGVTGHRDIHPHAFKQIKEVISNWLDQQILSYGGSNLIIQSPLAAGADQLVAQLAIEKGVKTIAPLPFPVERYKKDFDDSEVKMFSSLLGQVNSFFTVSAKPTIENRYLTVGAYIAQSSHALLALWDGHITPELEGGTAHIIRYQLTDFPEELVIKQPVGDRKTFWLQTPRSSASNWEFNNEFIQLKPSTYADIKGE
ncbi:hypothetical protein LCL96_18070 [Rossellomorea aquimaris]|uniref:hypothetical protein n=1 Tax=Rossellomorea aquimaris TaxID=189382 RepID=UPI001CD68C8E|nr:hypothetical protein [Rossellomorea aquimaris]MCA1060824.1 hypothetical protein [Rossellomorea aquimaris]